MLGYAIAFIVLIIIIGKVHESRTGHLPEWKYFKPYSVTWWVAAIPGVAGILISGDPMHGWHELTQTLQAATGGTDPQVLIYGSLGGIGLTGRVGGR